MKDNEMKAREFWFDGDTEENEPYIGYEVSRPPRPEYKQDWIHVIEYSAYESIKIELENWKKDYPFNIHKAVSDLEAAQKKIEELEQDTKILTCPSCGETGRLTMSGVKLQSNYTALLKLCDEMAGALDQICFCPMTEMTNQEKCKVCNMLDKYRKWKEEMK